MYRKSLIRIFVVTILLTTITIFNNIVLAAGSFSISTSGLTITEGSSSSFTINGSNAIGRVNISSSDSSIATVNQSSLWIENNSTPITVTGKKSGTAKITVSGTVADSNAEEAQVTKTLTVTVKAKSTGNESSGGGTTGGETSGTTQSSTKTTTTTTTKSSNAYLSTLGVTPKEYDFKGFNKDKTDYTVTIPNTVDSLKVIAKAAENGTVKITGNSGFEVGSNNEIKITVTSQDGKNSRTYTIKVIKLAAEEEKKGNVIEEEITELYLTSLSINGVNLSPEFSKDIHSYEGIAISKGLSGKIEVDAKANDESVNVEILGNDEWKIGENLINIILTKEGSKDQVVYQISVRNEEIITEENNQEGFINDLSSNFKKYIIYGIVLVLLIIIIIVVLIILLKKENKNFDKEDEIDKIKDRKQNNGRHTR